MARESRTHRQDRPRRSSLGVRQTVKCHDRHKESIVKNMRIHAFAAQEPRATLQPFDYEPRQLGPFDSTLKSAIARSATATST
jgi:hypothetical protein